MRLDEGSLITLDSNCAQEKGILRDVFESGIRFNDVLIQAPSMVTSKPDRLAETTLVTKFGLQSAESLLGGERTCEVSDNKTKAKLDSSIQNSTCADNSETVDAKEDAKPPKTERETNEERKKQISNLIELLGDDSFATREKSSKALIRIGRPALAQLECAADKDKDLEIRERSFDALSKILKECIKTPPTEGARVAALHTAGLKELRDSGNLSRETRRRYEEQITSMNPDGISAVEYDARLSDLSLRASGAPDREILNVRRQRDELAALYRIKPITQMQLDYADLLIKAADKTHAVNVLRGALKDDYPVLQQPSFQLLAFESGAWNNKDFAETFRRAFTRPGDVESDERLVIRLRGEHLGHELARKGPTVEMKNHFEDLVKSFVNHAKENPKDADFIAEHKSEAQTKLLASLVRHQKDTDAIAMMTKLLKEDRSWASYPLLHYADQIEAHKDKDFRAALEARKALWRVR